MQNDALTIGEYEEGDITDIIAIEKDSFPTPWSENIFRNEMTSPISRMLVGRAAKRQKGSVWGYIVYWRVDNEVHLHNIAVWRDMRRKKIAFRLLAEAIRRSRLEGARWATLEVRRSNLPAQKMYEKFGFVVKGIRLRYYRDTGEDALIMWADLSLICPEECAIVERGEARDA
jgi:ribosomal-protein-alanine N-acetyltransferase